MAAGFVGSFIYINFLREEAPETFAADADAFSDPVDPDVELEGTWQIAEGSEAGYRVQEILFGQEAEAVGRTSEIEGSFTLEGDQVTSGSFEADLTTVTSDEERRDNQFHGRIMETDTHPTASFELTEPLDLSSVEPQRTEGSATATGELTLHGVTRQVIFDIEGVRSGSQIQIVGSIPIVFADYDIDNPSGGPAQTEDNGLLEFSLIFEKQA